MSDKQVSKEFIKTPLFDFHKKLNAQMVDFCGYSLPVNYSAGAIKEHLHTRQASGLFDVSHMGQAFLMGDKSDQLLEKLVPADLQSLKSGAMRYTQLVNEDGGIVDDLLISRFPDAKYKFYLDADPTVRAHRRTLQLQEILGIKMDQEKVLEEITQRDKLDMTRSVCPLHPANDAIIIDTSTLSIDDVIGRIKLVVQDA